MAGACNISYGFNHFFPILSIISLHVHLIIIILPIFLVLWIFVVAIFVFVLLVFARVTFMSLIWILSPEVAFVGSILVFHFCCHVIVLLVDPVVIVYVNLLNSRVLLPSDTKERNVWRNLRQKCQISFKKPFVTEETNTKADKEDEEENGNQ